VQEGQPEQLSLLRTARAASIDGTAIAFSEWGNVTGPPVVLIHGWLFSRQAFRRQLQGELADRCRIVAYDLRGHGESDKPVSLADYSDGDVWAADLECVLAAVGIERPILAGWSLGGRVAAHYVFVNGPERVCGLNLISARILQPPDSLVNGESSRAEMTSAASGQSISATARFVRNCTNSPFSEEEGKLFLGAALAVPPIAQQGASAWHMDYGTFFDELDLPTLVTHGGNDPLTLPSAAENISRRLRGTLSIYPHCGHMPFWEEPARFDHELAEFAERARRGPPY
jgi:non-heme chloroperoxidase